MTIKNKYKYIIDYFSKHNPNANSELQYENAYQLLVAVILSAQCTDKRVNIVTPHLFESYPSAKEMKEASIEEIFEKIKSISYPNSKAKYLKNMSIQLVEEFHSIVPDSIELLQKLPGVGRKTANVIASIIFNQPAMAVDTHVFRVAKRLGLSNNAKTPLETEKQLTANFPIPLIAMAHHWLILHGRYVCTARKPQCEKCGIKIACSYYSELKEEKKI